MEEDATSESGSTEGSAPENDSLEDNADNSTSETDGTSAEDNPENSSIEASQDETAEDGSNQQDTGENGTGEETLIGSGITNNLSWQISKDGKLSITGSGDYELIDGHTPWWQHRDKITSIEVNADGLTSAKNMFSGCENVEDMDLSGFDTSKVTDMSGMFSECNIQNKWLRSFDTSNVTNMSEMFMGNDNCGIYLLDLSHFDTSNVTDMSRMFKNRFAGEEGCYLNFNGFDTSKVTNMSEMFCGTDMPDYLDLRSFDTGKVTDMSGMFDKCSAAWEITSCIDLSSFDTSNVTNMSRMFRCQYADYTNPKLMIIGLSNFDTSKVTDMSQMFKGRTVESLDLTSFDTSSVTNMSEMFADMDFGDEEGSLDLSSFDMGSVTAADNMLFGEDESLNLSHIAAPKNCKLDIKLPLQYTYNPDTDRYDETGHWYQDEETIYENLPLEKDYSIDLYWFRDGCKDMPYLFVKSWLPKTKINGTGTRSADNSANHVFFISLYLVQSCTSEKVT